MSTVKKRGLGRGLASLLSEVNQAAALSSESSDSSVSSQALQKGLQTLPVDLLQRGKYQPRRHMDEQALNELAASIKVSGIIQPLVVRKVAEQRYEIIAGERRWRAAQLAGLHDVPVVLREIDDHQASALALIENIQREDLNPLEEAVAYQRLIDEFSLTHEGLADLVGKSRAAISNTLRILHLNADVQVLLSEGKLEFGHAKVLLALTGAQQSQAAKQVAMRALSVRETEQYVKQLQSFEQMKGKGGAKLIPEIRDLQEKLSALLGAKVKIQHSASGKGKMLIAYSDLDQLDGILQKVSKETFDGH